MPVSATRQWRQNWGHMGSQGFSDQDLMLSVSMTSSMESSRDAFSMRHSEASQQVCPLHPLLQLAEQLSGPVDTQACMRPTLKDWLGQLR